MEEEFDFGDYDYDENFGEKSCGWCGKYNIEISVEKKYEENVLISTTYFFYCKDCGKQWKDISEY